MRDDFAKLLVERPRLGGKMERKGRTRHHSELPKQEGIKKRYGYNTKNLNENLSPLRRFIETQVGRPWDKVYSEIRLHIKPGNTVQEHILQHLYDFIHVKVSKVPVSAKFPCGLAYHNHRWGGGIRTVRDGDIYVDPDDNIIKRAKRRLLVPPKKQGRRGAVWYDDKETQICVKHAGIWYAGVASRFEIEAYTVMKEYKSVWSKKPYTLATTAYRFLVDGERRDTITDHFFGLVSANDLRKLEKKYGVKHIYVAPNSIRQLSFKHLRRLNLKNEVAQDVDHDPEW